MGQMKYFAYVIFSLIQFPCIESYIASLLLTSLSFFFFFESKLIICFKIVKGLKYQSPTKFYPAHLHSYIFYQHTGIHSVRKAQ